MAVGFDSIHDRVNFADCCRSLLPENVQNGELQLRGTNRLCSCHGGAL